MTDSVALLRRQFRVGATLEQVWMDVRARSLVPGWTTLARLIFLSPGFRTTLIYRLSHKCYRSGGRVGRLMGWMLFNLNHALSGCEIKPSAIIGGGLVIPHATGIVIGERVNIGENCYIYQNVTLRVANQVSPAYPTLGNGVKVYSGACVVGRVRVGDNAVIGANAVVLEDVPSGSTAVGVPARVIHRKASTAPSDQ